MVGRIEKVISKERLTLQADGQLSIGPEIRARLSPLIWEHINFYGSYPFTRPGAPGNLRPLRDATAEDDEQD
ncbi:hypothetical protein DQ384_23625 [Sphaerisporangium album]|uniref:Uncharacterized protein n=1 Tax=Sphaerisporangium album TaxID=509200 RepID=A0A367FEM7_9ACTN|nr:hypothetical protein DQ384_23625 [Sphaerisporangium album]